MSDMEMQMATSTETYFIYGSAYYSYRSEERFETLEIAKDACIRSMKAIQSSICARSYRLCDRVIIKVDHTKVYNSDCVFLEQNTMTTVLLITADSIEDEVKNDDRVSSEKM